MDYCRALKFEQEPNYKTCLNMFTHCMERHNFDATLTDFTWKQNRLSKDKEALKNSVLNVIRRKPKADETEGGQGALDQGTKKITSGVAVPEYANGQYGNTNQRQSAISKQ